jgi:Tol biopolymer transport system component
MSEVDYLMDVDTGEMTTLPDAILGTSGGRRGEQPDGRYAASPDGSTLAFTGLGVEGSPQIFIGNIDGTGVRQVTHDPVSATSPAWSPDGSTIAYVESGRDGIGPLVLLDVATGGTTLVTTEDASGPTFTPDGASLLFTASGPEYPLELRTVPITGGDSTPLFGADAGIDDSGNGSISPDGSLVTYLSSDTPPTDEARHCGPCRFLAFVDGSNRQVINGWMANAAGTWSPDGSRIVAEEILSELEMERLGGTYTDVILVVDVATEEATVVAYGRTAIWVDDHTILVEV